MPTTSDRGLFVWHEVSCKDLRSSENFYSQLVGWKVESWSQNPAYRLFMLRREMKAGLWAITEQPNQLAAPPHWLCYIGTPDVDATVRQAVELGGKVVVPAYNVPGVGRMAHLQDPQGVLFAVSSQERRTGYHEPEPGDFSWHELMTTNAQTAWDFYSKLFGWQKMETVDMGPAGPYQIFGVGGHQLGGLFAPASLPGGPTWLPYIHVRDAKRLADSARELGATIANGPMEVPGGDWIFTGTDPQAALFAVHSKKRVIPSPATKAPREVKTARSTRTTKARSSSRAKTAKPAKKKAAGKATVRKRK